jgi:uncharacterized RDD family membrane protein YckC
MSERNPYSPPRSVVERTESERETEAPAGAHAGAWLLAGLADLVIMQFVAVAGMLVISLLLLQLAPDLVRPGYAELDGLDTFVVPSTIATGAVLLLYHPLLEASPWRASLGKRLCGLRLAVAPGRRITLVRALARHVANLGMILCAVMVSPLLLLGLLAANAVMITVTPRGQALHDLATGVRLVRVPRGD